MRQLARVPSSTPVEKRYRVNELTGCWIFLGSIDVEGYGRVGSIMAHRYVYQELVGPVPRDMELDHLCVRPQCVNPAHMEIVTPEVNRERARLYRVPAEWSRETCGKGHKYTPENTRYGVRQSPGKEPFEVRVCLSCERIRKGRPLPTPTP